MIKMNVPFINIKDSIGLDLNEVINDWSDIYSSAGFIGGDRVVGFENILSQKLNVMHAITCANGTDALIVALQAIGVGHGSKVAIPNLTFWATYEAVIQVGATPVLIDIDPNDLQMSFDELKDVASHTHLDAVILVHLMGWTSSKLFEFRSFCEKSGIYLLEDGAQAYGVQVGGESVFSNTKISTLSFYPAKVFGGVMDGGAILVRDVNLANKCRSLCNHGRRDHYSYEYVGWNSRMSALQAAYLTISIRTISEKIASRVEALKCYKSLLEPYSELIKFYDSPQTILGNGYLAVVETKLDGQFLSNELKKRGVNCGRVYPETIDEQKPASGAIKFSNLKYSKSFASRVINLPLFAGITIEQCQYSANQLINILSGSNS